MSLTFYLECHLNGNGDNFFFSLTRVFFLTYILAILLKFEKAEKAKLEPDHLRGQLQSTCYACRFFGLMVAAPISTVVYSKFGPKTVISIMAMLPGIMLPLIWNFSEIKNMNVKSTKEQCQEIWSTVCSRAVWQPLGFVSFLNSHFLIFP